MREYLYIAGLYLASRCIFPFCSPIIGIRMSLADRQGSGSYEHNISVTFRAEHALHTF